jgi:hypothetical protein
VPTKERRAVRLLISDPAVGVLSIESLPSMKHPLHVEFEVTKSLSFEANRCTVRLTNLARDTRNLISGLPTPRRRLTNADRLALEGIVGTNPEVQAAILQLSYMKLFAGFNELSQQIFEGGIEPPIRHSRPDNVTVVTTIDSGDGARVLRDGFISRTYATNFPYFTMIELTAKALGFRLSEQTKTKLTQWLTDEEGAMLNTQGSTTFNGRARDVFDELLNIGAILESDEYIERIALGLEDKVRWTVLDGEIVIIGPRDMKAVDPVEVRQELGMVGRPEMHDSGDITVEMLLEPRMGPGVPVALHSRDVRGTFRCESCRHFGDTGGGPFRTVAELRPFDPTGVAA